jgi:hypothetical protein
MKEIYTVTLEKEVIYTITVTTPENNIVEYKLTQEQFDALDSVANSLKGSGILEDKKDDE